MLKDLIVGVLEGIARAAKVGRETFGKTVEEAGRDIRNGALMANDAFSRAKDDAGILDKLYGDREPG